MNTIGRLIGGYFWLNVLLNVLAIVVFLIFGTKVANWQLGVLMAGSFVVLILTSIRIGDYQLFQVFPGRGGWTVVSIVLIIAIGGIWFFGDQLLSATSSLRMAKFNRWSVEIDQQSVGERIYLIKEGAPYFTEDLQKTGIVRNSEEGYYVNKKIKHEGEDLIGLMLKNGSHGSRFVKGTVIFVSVRDIKLVRVYSEQEQKILQLSKAKAELESKLQAEREMWKRAEEEARCARSESKKSAPVEKASVEEKSAGKIFIIDPADDTDWSPYRLRITFPFYIKEGSQVIFKERLQLDPSACVFINRSKVWRGGVIQKGTTLIVPKEGNDLLIAGSDQPLKLVRTEIIIK